MRTAHQCRHGFSLLELIIVVAIIVLLIGILLPVVSRIRESGRSTACLANLQQWGYVYQMYLNINHGRSIAEWHDPLWEQWYQQLAPYAKSGAPPLLCPSAVEPRTREPLFAPDASITVGRHGSATQAWVWQNQRQPSRQFGSYGFNSALWDISVRHLPAPSPWYLSFPVKDAARVPTFFDCVYPIVALAYSGDQPPKDLLSMDDAGSSIPGVCMDRHTMAVNVAFFDGHAEHVPLPALFGFRWNDGYLPHNVVIPGL